MMKNNLKYHPIILSILMIFLTLPAIAPALPVGGGFSTQQGEQMVENSDNSRERIKHSIELIQTLIKNGFPASIGEDTQYTQQQWTRDIAKMTDALVQTEQGRIALTSYLNKLMSHVIREDEENIYYSLREGTTRKGEFPIVIPVDDKKFMKNKFLDSGGKYRRFNTLKGVVAKHLPDFHSELLETADAESFFLSKSHQEIKEEIKRIKDATEPDKLPEDAEKTEWSILLSGYLDNKRPTPETTDSELSALYITTSLVEAMLHNKEEQQFQNNKELFSDLVAYALLHIFQNLISPESDLHVGVGSLDIIGDFLNGTASLAVNSRLLMALKKLSTVADHLDHERIRTVISTTQCNLPDSFLLFSSDSTKFNALVKTLIEKQKNAIQTKLLFQEEIFKPRGFIRDNESMKVVMHTKVPDNISRLVELRTIEPDGNDFSSGKLFDPYGLAWAILAGAVPEEHYTSAYTMFNNHFQRFKGFQFIPMEKPENSDALENNRGRTLWPHRLGKVALALVKMFHDCTSSQEECLTLAKDIHTFMTELGFNEYYLHSNEWVWGKNRLPEPDLSSGQWLPDGAKNQSWAFVTYFLLSQALNPTVQLY